MKTFAYIATPINIKQLKEQWQALKFLPDCILNPLRKLLPKYKIIKLGKFASVQGRAVKGYKIVYPLLDVYKQDNLALERIISSCRIAEKLGVKLIGLSGYAAVIADKNYNKIFKAVKTPMTSGNALSAWSIFEEVYRLAKARNISLSRLTLLIIGADTQIGFLTARKLAECVTKIIITGQDTERLKKLKETILHQNSIEIIITSDIESSLKEADIVVNLNEIYASNSELKEGVIYCCVKDLLIKAYAEKCNKFIHPSLAEAVLLVLEDKIVSYSLGENSNLDKLEEIADIAVQHGFEVWVPEAPVL